MSRKEELKYFILVAIIFIAACMETDIYLPAFPDIMKHFSVSEGTVQGLLTWNFLGICISGPFYGPWSDSFGRKRPLLASLVLFFLGSVMTVFATGFSLMIVGRLLQGLGAGGCFTLGTAILFDVFQKEKAVNALNRLSMAIPVIMSIAPGIGAALNYHYGFRSNFLFIAFLVFLSLFACFFFFTESLSSEKRLPFHPISIGKSFQKILASIGFWQLTLATGLLFAGYIGFLSYTGVLFVSEFGISKTVAPWFQMMVLAAWTIGGFFLKRVLSAFGERNIKKIGSLLCLSGGIFFSVASFQFPENPYVLTITLLPYIFGANWVFGLYFPEVMELFPESKGVAASLVTSARLLIASITVGGVSMLYNQTIYPLTATIIITMVVIFPSLFFYEKNRSVTGKNEEMPSFH